MNHRLRAFRTPLLILVLVVLLTGSFTVSSLTSITRAAGAITGNVFRDFNANGIDDGAGEAGVPAVTVTAYNAAGVAQGTATTSATGDYTLNATGTGPYRLEFTTLPAGAFTGPSGTGSASTVQFVPDGNTSNVNLGISFPSEYLSPTARMTTSIFINGDPLTGGTSGTQDALVRFPLTSSGSPANTRLAQELQVGAVWGLAYQRETDTLFASAVVRRHSGLGTYSTDGSNGAGPLDQTGGRNSGTGGIYMVQNANSASPIVAPFVDVQAIGINTGNFTQARALPNTINTPSTDAPAFSAVGKLGIGDLDVSPDGQYLYLTNLNDRTVYRLFIGTPAVTPTPADVTSYPNVPWLTSNPCINGVARPFGLKPFGALVYVGVTCTGETGPVNTSANLTAVIYALDPVAGTASEVLNVPLTYLRGRVYYYWGAAGWYPWTDAYNDTAFNNTGSSIMRSTPILSDLEFDSSGAMILGFTDRVGMQMTRSGYLPDGRSTVVEGFAGGDILRACPDGSGWRLENAGICGGITGAGTNDNTFGTDFAEGPGNNEFYNDNIWQPSATEMSHEAALGALATIPGLNQIATTAQDAGGLNSNGVSWLSNADGSVIKNYRVYSGSTGRMGKAVGIGDLELLNPLAPIEIGNRIWRDSNTNGRQDPGEPVLAGVTVTLFDSTAAKIGTATTNANGEYLFNSSNVAGGIQPNADYQIRIPTSQGVLAGLVPTRLNYNGNAANSDLNDSDGDPAINAGFVTAPLTTGSAGANNHTYDFGFVPIFSLGNRVFVDANNNGIFDGSDSGLVGVTVNLYRDSNNDGVPDGAALATQATLANGYYLFTDLAAGTYVVEIVPPAGYISSTGTNGSASGPFEPAPDADSTLTDNDDNGTTRGAVIRSAPVTLAVGGEPTGEPATPGLIDSALDANSNLTVDFGLFPPINLGDLVWSDVNNNGVVDGAESGIANVPVELYKTTQTPGVDPPIAITTTDASGHYQFTNLTPGNYVVLIPNSAFATGGALEHQTSSTGTNGSPSGPSEPAPDPDTNVNNANNGSNTPAGVASLPVTLSLHGEPPVDVDGDGTDGNLTVDFGFFQPASLGDFVWYDTTANGLQDVGEAGVVGVTATLYNAADNSVVATTTTDANGAYHFDYLIPGSYYVIFSKLPGGYDFVTPDLGADALDSDANSITGRTGTYTLVAGQHEPTVDAGIASGNTLRLGNLLWADYNDNGLVDSGEPGIAGVTVELFDSTNALIATITTDANGHYLFSNLTPGDYTVRIPASQFVAGGPLEHWASSSAGGTYEPASDPDSTSTDNDDNGSTSAGAVASAPVTLSLLGEPDSAVDGDNTNGNLTVDFGFVPQLASLGDVIWYDHTRNNVQDPGELGVPGVTVRLYDANGTLVSSQVSNATGHYLFSNLVPGDYSVVFDISTLPGDYRFVDQDNGVDDTLDSDPNILTGQTVVTTLTAGENDLTWDAGVYQLASIGDYVWYDRNRDGIQDASESGAPNVTVNLLDSDGIVVATTTTAATGAYLFSNLEPGGYQVQFVPPAGYTFTAQNRTIDTNDSDANPVSGRTSTTTLAPGEHDLTWDAGLIGNLSLGDLVWEDRVNSGTVNTGELGIAGVAVRLYQDSNNDGLPDGPALATTTTNASGNYLFSNLVPGTYLVEVTPPAGYRSSTGTNGGATGPYEAAPDPDNDINNDDNGTTVGAVIRSGSVSLSPAAEPITDGDTDANSNLTVDFGLFRPASLGDYVWHDQNANGVQDAGEPGVPGVTVTLYDQLGHAVATTTTDASGGYRFDNLIPGTYSVGFSHLPAGLTFFTAPNSGSDDAVDSDATPSTGRTTSVTLTVGEHNPTLDAGLVAIQITAITLTHFGAIWQGHTVQLEWTTSSEIDTFSFQLLRSRDGTRASATRVTEAGILARGRGQGGASYSWTDTDVEQGQAYTYWLEETEVSGQTYEYGPLVAQARTTTVTSPIFIPIMVR